MHVLKQWKF